MGELLEGLKTFLGTPPGWLVAIAAGWLGYAFGRRRDAAKVVHERKAELSTQFIRSGYKGQGLLWRRPVDWNVIGAHRGDFSVLGEELRFYVGPAVGAEISDVTASFYDAVNGVEDLEVHELKGTGARDRIDAFLPELNRVHASLRRELGTASLLERASWWWDQAWLVVDAVRRSIKRRKLKT